MIFNSIIFVFFFTFIYTIYLLLSHRLQNLFLLAMSYVFYAFWDWRFTALLLLTTFVDYSVAIFMENASSPERKRAWLLLSLCSNLGILFFFKYFNFFADSFTQALSILGMEADPITLKIILPVGISFYTFQSMSYTIDVYRGELKASKSLVNFALYVSFFPQLVAGPIERAKHLLPQVERKRNIHYADVREGAWLLLLGYFKKVVLADNFAVFADTVFNNPGDYSGIAVLLGVYAFAFQIYGDFSGYSDIARGTAKLMGFDLMVNFRMPYFAQNPQDFWRRWHISLSTWLRDYLYVPLGGNRGGKWRTHLNLFLTMLLGGIWHGAAWNFILWGAYHGAALVLHRMISGDKPKSKGGRVVNLLKMFFMFHMVCFGWILFRINHISDLNVLLGRMFQPSLEHFEWAFIMFVFLWPVWILQYAKERSGNMLVVKDMHATARACVYALFLCYIFLCGKVNGNEFIYFQF